MQTGMFIVEGGIGDINEKIFRELKERTLVANTIEADAIEESGGVPIGVKVKNRILTLNKGTKLLQARVAYEIKL